MDKEIEITADGWATLYVPEIREHYHSVKGAMAEGCHVYVCNGLLARLYAGKNKLKVFEVGFGTGLNAALTAEKIPGEAFVDYIGVELYPPEPKLLKQLGYGERLAYYDEITNAQWGEPVRIGGNMTLLKVNDDFTSMELPSGIDVVYFDAFAPDRQPSMWSAESFRRLYSNMSPGAILTTYCAKGVVRRLLGEIGFIVSRMPGPPGGKREILKAVKPTSDF